MKTLILFFIFLVSFVPQLKCVRGTDNGTRCQTLDIDYSVLLKLVQLEEKVSKQESTIKEQGERIEVLTSEIKDNRQECLKHTSVGSTYIRWGGTTCPRGATEVYQGYAAGSYFTHTGAAANPLCLTTKPTWGYYTGKKEPGAFIYGAEYETSDYSKWNYLYQHDAPCVVCRVPYSEVLMVPGTKVCPNSYTLQYHGYLMAGRHDHPAATDYICVDGNPEVLEKGYENKNGFLLYFVQAQCGSLPCGPYIQNREITCAICSRN